jgi:hypothetical protein
MHAQQVEIIAGGFVSPQMAVFSALAQGDWGDTVGHQAGERAVAVAKIGVVRIGLRETGGAELVEFPRPVYWQRTQQEAVERAESGGISADGEGERDDGDGGEPRSFAEPAQSETQVLQHVLYIRRLIGPSSI